MTESEKQWKSKLHVIIFKGLKENSCQSRILQREKYSKMKVEQKGLQMKTEFIAKRVALKEI